MENKLFEFISKYMTLTDEEKRVILELNLFRNYKKGTVLLSEGDYSDENYFVLQGCLRCYYIIDGEEKTTEFFTELAPFSPICSINKMPSEYYVSCVEDCILSVATSEMETEVFRSFPRFESLCRILTEELLAENQGSFAEFKNASPEERYLNLLETRPSLLQRVPQYQIASYLGITPESLSRIRKRMLKKNP